MGNGVLDQTYRQGTITLGIIAISLSLSLADGSLAGLVQCMISISRWFNMHHPVDSNSIPEHMQVTQIGKGLE